MKAVLSKDDFGKLPEAFQSEYTLKGDEYQLNLEGGPDTGALLRAKEHEKTARQTAEQELAKLRTKYDTLNDTHTELLKGNVPKDNVTALEASWKQKLTDKETELTGQISKLKGSLNDVLVDSVADSLASEISTVPRLMKNEILRRLTTEEVDGKVSTRILDKDGKPSALTVDDLKQEFLANEEFSSIIIANKASGGGAQGSKGQGSATTLKDMSEAEQVKLARENPEKFDQLASQTT